MPRAARAPKPAVFPPAPPKVRWKDLSHEERVRTRLKKFDVEHVKDPRFNPPPPPLKNVFAPPDDFRIPVEVSLTELGNAVLKGTTFETLFEEMASFHDDPLGFVLWAFPWGEPGTSLQFRDGPEDWQQEQLIRIGERVRAGGHLGCVVEEDTTAGRGVGKSALVSWIVLWAISTFPDTRGVVTANTDTQLRTKTWAEVAKWYSMFIGKAFFKLTATSIYIANDDVREKEWRIDAIPWSKENAEAFNGLHNQGKRLLILFDEASAIDDSIWVGTEGTLTDANTQILWLRYGNPTRTSGEFFNRCTKPKRNHVSTVDSRSVTFSNKEQIRAWIDDYGVDSDFVRVHVRGLFPRAGLSNFISVELVDGAARRLVDPLAYRTFPKVLSVDPARFGDDFSVITLRQGLMCYWQVQLAGFDGPDLAARIFEIVRQQGMLKNSVPQVQPGPISCIVYDAIGNGADLDSTLRRMPGLPPLIPVQWGQPAKDDKQYFNQRSECWGRMRDWLEHGRIPEASQSTGGLGDQLTSLDYGYDVRFRIQLMSKREIKRNGGKSPDLADSLALSFIPELIDRKVTLAKVRPTERRKVIWSR